MRMKIIVPELKDFDKVVREISQVASIRLQSERRRFITTDGLPAKTQADLEAQGFMITTDERYDIEFG